MTAHAKPVGNAPSIPSLYLLGALLVAGGACANVTATANDADEAAANTQTEDPDVPSVVHDAGRKIDAASATGPTPSGSTATNSTSPGESRTADAASRPAESGRADAGGRANAEGGAGDVTTGSSTDAGPASDSDDCVEDTSAGGSSASAGTTSGNGKVFFYSTGTSFVRLQTKLVVPNPPKKNSVLFLWPGLQPVQSGRNFNPIGMGVLQPVLTWGPSCAPNQIGEKYDSWWISAQYVNTIGNHQGYTGCHGGASMKVGVGDILDIDMSLSGTRWMQTVTDEKTGKAVDFDFDMMGQDQGWALFVIEDTYNSPSEDVIFRSTVLTYASPALSACTVGTRGTNDYVAKPRPLKDGLACCIPRIVLRARGVAATSPD